MDEDIESPDIPRLVVYNTKGVEYETVVMTATVITATFSGSIGVTDDAAEGSSDSGSLNVVPGDIIQIAYLDSSPPKNTLTNYRIPSVGRAEFIPKNDAEWTAAAPVIIGEDSLRERDGRWEIGRRSQRGATPIKAVARVVAPLSIG